MSRQVDIKALVSHVIRGDGVNRCRICMGETTEGQVYLSDTVMMDGERPVTLSEILETVTGIQVVEEREVPRGLCCTCTESAIAAWKFRHLCHESHRNWTQVAYLNITNEPTAKDRIFFISTAGTLLIDHLNGVDNVPEAKKRLNHLIENNKSRKPPQKYKKKPKTSVKCKCEDCGKEFQLPYLLNRHLINTRTRACTLCGKVVPREKLMIHLKKSHQKTVEYCEVCYKLFNEQLELEHHKTLHGDSHLQCKICKYPFKNERSLRAHMYVHTLFICFSCNSSFENRKCYLYHKTHCNGMKSSSQSLYECDDCGSKYTKKPSLKTHIIQKHLNVLPYICQICGKRSSTKTHHRSHELIHKTERQIYQCHCGAKLRTAVGFHMHQRIHSGEKPYRCEECGDRFLSASRRLDHIKRKHRAKELGHKCVECGARFVRPFELKKHTRSVHFIDVQDEQLFPQGLCISCTSTAVSAFEFRIFVTKSRQLWNNCIHSLETFPTLNTSRKSLYAIIKENLLLQTVNHFEGNAKDLVEHLANRLVKKKSVLTERKPRHPRTGPACHCIDCGKSFVSPYYLNLHLRNSGQKEACLMCGVILTRGQEMKEHLFKNHKTNMLLCTECPLLFNSDVELKQHNKKCHSPGVLTCSDCGRTFQRKASFEVHTQMHTVRTCRACGTQFTNRGCYREHRAKCEPDAKPNLKTISRSKRSNVRDPAAFTCDYCGKTYRSRPQLKNHILWIHMDVRPHQCQWCGKRFYTPARLSEHSVVHTRVRNFECDICGAKLVSKMAAVYHRRRHTGERPYECEDCGEKFISSSRRSEHAKRRHNRGCINCPECMASFVRSHDMKKHMDKVHNAEKNHVVKVNKENELFSVAL